MKTFISYSHQDESWFERLKIHIAPLIRKGDLSIWSDHEVLAGQPLNSEISKNMESAELFLLLLSPAYFASDYCMNVELNHALVRHQSDDVKIVPIIVEACNWQSISKLNDLKIIPKDAKPISNWEDQNTAFVDVIEEIDRLVMIESRDKETGYTVTKLASPVLIDEKSQGNNQSNRIELDAQELKDQLIQGNKNFSGVRVKNLELINYDLQRVDFSEADLSSAKLEGSNLSGANLVGTILTDSDLYAANLSGANITNASLNNAELMGANLMCSNLWYTNLSRSHLEEAQLRGANLVSSRLEDADLFAANLICANLWGTNLVNANLASSSLISANLTLTKLMGANFENANLSYASLLKADLRNASLVHSILEGANLEGVKR